jgi:hypothetical protein
MEASLCGSEVFMITRSFKNRIPAFEIKFLIYNGRNAQHATGHMENKRKIYLKQKKNKRNGSRIITDDEMNYKNL